VTTTDAEADGHAHVSWDDFRECIGAARRYGEIVPIGELVARHRAGRPTSGLIALTFDDAYAALLGRFADFLYRERIPVSVFAVIDGASSGLRFWWDRIDDLFTRTPPARWRAFEDACGLTDGYRRGQPGEYGPLRPLRQWVLATFAGRWPQRLESVLQALEQEVGYCTRQRAMTFDELTAFAAMPGIEVGVHTVSHPVLPLLSDSEIRREIDDAYVALRDRFSNAIPILAVPFGLYDERTLRAARSVGMIACLTLSGDTLGRGSRHEAVPRICITKTDACAKLGMRLLGIPRLIRACSGRLQPVYPALPSATT
jgi:peptidoglycan/xylan/chitin deacetylase (PgdA/CDA1 family)